MIMGNVGDYGSVLRNVLAYLLLRVYFEYLFLLLTTYQVAGYDVWRILVFLLFMICYGIPLVSKRNKMMGMIKRYVGYKAHITVTS